MHHVNAFTCLFSSSFQKKRFCFFSAKVRIKHESLDCEVYKKANVKQFTSQITRKHPRSSHDDQFEV